MGKKKSPPPAPPARDTVEATKKSEASSARFEEAFQALAEIDRRLSVKGELGSQALGLDNPCEIYGEISPYIRISLDFVDWLPRGKTIRNVLVILMKLADEYCRTSPEELAVGPGFAKPSGADALAKIEEALTGPAPLSVRSIGEDACKDYHAIRKYIEPAMEFIEWLPYGPIINRVVKLLMRLADAIC